jgi:hypothetical protein
VEPYETTLDVDLEPTLAELVIAHDVGGEARDVVGIEQSPVFPVLACEENGAAPLDLHDVAITEPHRADDVGVEIREDLPESDHLVGGPNVIDPPLGVPLSYIAQHRINLLFHQLDMLLGHG